MVDQTHHCKNTDLFIKRHGSIYTDTIIILQTKQIIRETWRKACNCYQIFYIWNTFRTFIIYYHAG